MAIGGWTKSRIATPREWPREGFLDRVFVYGTLRGGQPARRLIDEHVIAAESATVSGHMYAFPDGYPGILLDPNGPPIVGEVVQLRCLSAAFALLDAYEGDDFIRVPTTAVTRDGQEMRAWCYVIISQNIVAEGTLVASGDWVSFDADF